MKTKSAAFIVFSEVIGGVVLGLIIGTLGLAFGASNFLGLYSFGGLIGWEAGGALGALIGITLGSSLGVYLTGRFFGMKSPYSPTLVFSIIGFVLSLLIYDYRNRFMTLIVLILPVIGSLVGFNLKSIKELFR